MVLFSDSGWLAVFVSILAIIISIVIYLKQRTQREITYEIVSNAAIVNVSNEDKDQIQVLFKRKPLNDARLIIIRIWNSGNTPILSTEFNEPISFDFGEKAEVLETNVLETEPPNIKNRVKAALKLEEGKVKLEPLLLNSQDSIKLKMLVTQMSSTINLDAHIVGVKLPLHHSSVSESRLFSRNKRRQVMIGLLSALGGIVVGGSGSFVWLRYFQKTSSVSPIAKSSPSPTRMSSPQPTQSILSYKITRIYRHHTGGVFSTAWSRSGKYIASTGLDKTVQIWDPNSSSDTPLFMSSLFGTGESVTWSPDDRYIATGDDSASNFVHIWDWQANKSIYNAPQVSQLRSIAWSPDGKYLAFGTISDKIVQAKVQVLDVSDITNVHSVLTYIGHSATIQEITWSPDSKFIASASVDHTVQIWNALDKSVRFIYTGHSAQVWSVAWSPDGKSIASGDINGEVHMWNVPQIGQKSAEDVLNFSFHGLEGHICAHALSWSYDNNFLVTGSWNKTVVVVRIRDKFAFPPFENHKGAIGTVAWSPHSNLIASASSDNSDTTIQIWQAFPL